MRQRATLQRRRERGLTLLEVMIAMMIMFVGLLGLLALFGTAVSATQYAQQDLIAKQKAREALEAIYSARDDSQVSFAQIQNDNVPLGIFKSGFQSLYRISPGSSGILGTASEGPQLDYVYAPDANGQLTVQVPLTNYQRQIEIDPTFSSNGNVNDNLRMIKVTVRVAANAGQFRDYTVAGYISSYH